MKIVLTVNTSFNVVNFRSRLVRTLLDDGHDVLALVPADETTERLRELVTVAELPMNNKGMSPLEEAWLLLRVGRALWRERPDALLSFTIKNNIYGSMCARALGIPYIPNVTGLGVAFGGKRWLDTMVRPLCRFAFRRAPVVFFQNPEDKALFVKAGIVRVEQARLLPGSGVDLDRFFAAPPPEDSSHIRFLLIARMLWDKGIGDYVEAARKVKRSHPQAVFQLLGPLGVKSPGAIDEAVMRAWLDEGIVEYLGATDDVRTYIHQADCVVLPSFYHEGTPRSLLEAAATARPVITTDMPGCRDTVDDPASGFLCRARDFDDLARKMIAMIEVGPQGRAEMGRRGREKMERGFDERVVIEAYREELQKIAVARGGGRPRKTRTPRSDPVHIR